MITIKQFFCLTLTTINTLCLSSFSYGQSTSPHELVALSKADHTLAIVDAVSLKVIVRIPVGNDPHEVIVTPDGTTAYVTNYGGGSLHTLNVIDLVNKKALDDIDTRPLFGPHDLTFVNGKVWFTAEGSKAVGRYDPAAAKLDWSMGTGQDRTHMIYVTDDMRKIYTTNVASGTVSILTDSLLQPGKMAPPNAQPRQDWIHTLISVGKGAEGFDVLPNGNELWTAASEDGSIYIIDLLSKKLKTKVEAKITGANRLKFTPDGKRALVSSISSGDLAVFDTASRKEIKRLHLGRGASGILINPDGSQAFVACSADNIIKVIDLRTYAIAGQFDVGKGPDGLAWIVRQ